MKKETILLSIIAIILLVSIVFFVFNSSGLSNETIESSAPTIKVGDVLFDLPKNYTKIDSKNNKDLTISNGKNEIYFHTFNKDVSSVMNDYIDDLNNRGYSENLSNFTVNDTVVYKVLAKNTTTVHYWFDLNGMGYTIYSWDNTNLDGLVKDFINSA